MVSLGAALVAGVAWRGPARVVAWFQDERNLLSRIDAWRDAWDVIQAFPVFGTGLNTFGDAMLFYQKRNAGFHMAQAHNDYVQLAAEGGLLVVVPALVAAVLLAHAIRQNLRAARPESRGYWIRAGAAIGLVAVAFRKCRIQSPDSRECIPLRNAGGRGARARRLSPAVGARAA